MQCCWDCCCDKHHFIPPWKDQKIRPKLILAYYYRRHHKKVFEILVYTTHLYLKALFITSYINRYLDLEDQFTGSLYDLKFLLLLNFLLPYTCKEYQWKLFIILYQNDFICKQQIFWTGEFRSKRPLSLILKFIMWFLVECILFHVNRIYSLKILVYGFHSLEALLSFYHLD